MTTLAEETLTKIQEFLSSEEADDPRFRGVRQVGQHFARALSTAGAGAVTGRGDDGEMTPGQEAVERGAKAGRESGGEGPTAPNTGDKKPSTFQEAREAAQEVVRGQIPSGTSTTQGED